MAAQDLRFHSEVDSGESSAQFDLFETINEQSFEQPIGCIPASRQQQDERLIEYEADAGLLNR